MEASAIMAIHVRENLGMKDGFFQNDVEHQMKLIQKIRKYRPEIVLCNAVNDRHIDHGKAARLESDACFLSGLIKIKTFDDKGNDQECWRPKAVYHYIQDYYIPPDLVVDITDEWPEKLKSINAFKSQFYNPDSLEPETPIATKEFFEFLPARAMSFGHIIGVKYGEGFTVRRAPGVMDITKLK